jgi:hypothetical protein
MGRPNALSVPGSNGGGGPFSSGLKFKGASTSTSNLKNLTDEIISLKRTCSVNFKLDCKSHSLLQEMLELGLSRVFLNITMALRIFVSLPA